MANRLKLKLKLVPGSERLEYHPGKPTQGDCLPVTDVEEHGIAASLVGDKWKTPFAT